MSNSSIVVAANENAAGKDVQTIHPGMSDERFLAIVTAAIRHVLGQPVAVVRFRHMDSMDWTWSVQGRVSIHNSHKLST